MFHTFAYSLLGAHLRAIVHGVEGEVYLGHGPLLVHRAINMAHSIHFQVCPVMRR